MSMSRPNGNVLMPSCSEMYPEQLFIGFKIIGVHLDVNISILVYSRFKPQPFSSFFGHLGLSFFVYRLSIRLKILVHKWYVQNDFCLPQKTYYPIQQN